jgi:aromatic-L-amino-acid/L-tryptophan decarboxylase
VHAEVRRAPEDRRRGGLDVHRIDQATEQMIRGVLAYAENRLRMDPVPLDQGTLTSSELYARLDGVIRDRSRPPDEVLGLYA